METRLAATCLLLSVAESDEILDDNEIQTIKNILQEFFILNEITSHSLVQQAQKKTKESIGLFEFGQQLNQNFSHDDKLDFISCIFEVAYADGELHYLEHHTIKKIANILK